MVIAMPAVSRIKNGEFLVSGNIDERKPSKFDNVTIEVASAGYNALATGSPAYVKLNGVAVGAAGRGINVTRFNEFGNFVDTANFDTHVTTTLGDNAASFINGTPTGWILAIVTADQPSYGTTAEWGALTGLGFTSSSVGAWIFRSAFAGIVRKGIAVLYQQYSAGDGVLGTGAICYGSFVLPNQIYFSYDEGTKNSWEGHFQPNVDLNTVLDDRGVSVEEAVTNLVPYGNSFDTNQSFWKPYLLSKTWADVWDPLKLAYRIGQGTSVYRLFSSPIPMPANPASDNSYTLSWEHLGYLYFTFLEYSEEAVVSSDPLGATIWKAIPKDYFTRIDNLNGWENPNTSIGIMLKSNIPYLTWTKETITVRVPATAKFVRFRYDGYLATTNGSRTMGGWIRKVSFAKKTFPTSHVEGSRGDGKLTYLIPARTPLSVVTRYNVDGTFDGQDRCIFSFDNDDHTFNTFSLWRTRFNTFRLLSGQSEASFSEISVPNVLINGDHTFVSTIDSVGMNLYIDNTLVGTVVSPKLPGVIGTLRIGNGSGLNLVRNGNAQMGNNTNFGSFQFYNGDSSDGDGKCFKAVKYVGATSDDLFPVDVTRQYFLTGDFKSVGTAAALGSLYFGVACYDKNKNFIEYNMVHHVLGSRTTLAQDLNPGDTTITLTNIANWWTGVPNDDPYAGNQYLRLIAFWDSSEYLPYTYTRNVTYYSTQDVANNKLTLYGPWTGAKVPAGTPIANSNNGGGYNYIASSGQGIPKTWTTSSAIISGEAVNNDAMFRYGTKYISILFLSNYWIEQVYGAQPDQILLFDKIKFYEANSNCFANSPIRYTALYNKILNPAISDKLGFHITNSTGDMNGLELNEGMMNIPADVYHFPLDADAIEQMGGVIASAESNVIYIDGAANVGDNVPNLLSALPIDGWPRNFTFTINPLLPYEYEIFCTPVNGWEQIYTPIPVVIGLPYIFQFDISVTSLAAAAIQILSSIPNNGNCVAFEIASYAMLASDVGKPYKRVSIPFTPTTNIIYLSFNFGINYDVVPIQFKIRDLTCVQNQWPLPPFYGPTRLKSKLEFNLNRDIGLDWNGEWTIAYFKNPVGVDTNASQFSVESLGSGASTGMVAGKSYLYFGKTSNSNNVVAAYTTSTNLFSAKTLSAFDPNDFFTKWQMVIISKSGTVIRVRYVGDKINGDVSIDVGTIASDCFVTSNGFDFKLDGYNWNAGDYTANSYFKDLIVARRCLTDEELRRMRYTHLRIYSSAKIQTKGSIKENSIL